MTEELKGARELFETADDEEMREMASAEIDSLQARLDKCDADLKLLLIPSDPNDEKMSSLDSRSTGGDEASRLRRRCQTVRAICAHGKAGAWTMRHPNPV